MRYKSVLGGLGVLLVTLTSVTAAPATSEQASSIKAALERYVGHGTGGVSSVSVSPDNDHYTVAIDLKQALRGIELFGVTLEPATYTFSLAPAPAGLWHVINAGLPRLTVKYNEDSYSVVVNGTAFDGLFDPQIPGFQSSSFSYDSMSVAAVGPKGGTQTREIDRGKQTSMSTSTGDGTATVQIAQSSDGFAQDINTGAMTGAEGSNGDVAVKSTASFGSVMIEDLHSRALADLWAFFVDHSSEDTIKASQEDLRAILRRALPVFNRLFEGGSADHIVLESPLGTFAAQSISGRVSTTGLVAQGQVGSEVRVDGLAIPNGLVPNWAEGLVPTSATLNQSFSGFHLDAAARQAVDSFDLKAKDPLTPQILDSMKTAVGSLDQMVFSLEPSHLASRLLNVDFDGTVKFAQSQPDVHINISASGLDAALAELQSRSAGDPQASQVVAVLVLAKGLGRIEPNGMMRWAVDRSAAGAITVNGLTLPGSTGK